MKNELTSVSFDLRYLVMMLDRNKVARRSRWFSSKDVEPPVSPEEQAGKPKKRWLSVHNEELWTPVCTIPKW